MTLQTFFGVVSGNGLKSRILGKSVESFLWKNNYGEDVIQPL